MYLFWGSGCGSRNCLGDALLPGMSEVQRGMPYPEAHFNPLLANFLLAEASLKVIPKVKM